MKTQTLLHRVRILPLGDSLTQGDGSPSSYRYHLFRLLSEAGIPFRFVGGVLGGDFRLPPDCRYHSGRGGITTNGLIAYHTEGAAEYLPAWVEAVRSAEVVLLCIGANDVFRKLPIEGYPERLTQLLDLLYTYNPEISTVYISTVRSRHDSLMAVNPYLLDPAFAAAEAKKGRDVRILDANAQGTPENLASDYPPDDGHPNEQGNRKTAEILYAGISARIRELAATLTPADALPPPPSVLKTAALTLPVGGGERIRLTPAPGGEVSYLFESDDTAVAEVDEDGTVYGRSEGCCTVQVRNAFERALVGSLTVSVSGVQPDPLEAYPVRHTPPLSEEGYTAPEKAIRPTADGICVRYPHWLEGEIETGARYPQDGVCIAFDMTAVSAFPPKGDGELTLSLGDTALTFRAAATEMTLKAGGESVTLSDPTPPFTRRPMRLVREGGRVSLLRGGVTLLSLADVGKAPEERVPLRITWRAYDAMIHYFYGLTVATRE